MNVNFNKEKNKSETASNNLFIIELPFNFILNGAQFFHREVQILQLT